MAWPADRGRLGAMKSELDLAWLDPRLRGLVRRDASGFGSGLCRAVAGRYGIDVTVVRVAFILMAFGAGFGLALYGWGTVLTLGASGTRPADSLLPRFGQWSLTAQKSLVVCSTVGVVIVVAALTSFPWLLAVVAGIWLLVFRHRAAAAAAPTQASAADYDDDTLIEQWRREMAWAAGSRQPRASERLATAPSAMAITTSPVAASAWGWGTVLLILASVAGAVGWWLTGSFLTALAIIGATLGLACLACGVLLRERRLPRVILAVIVAVLAVTGWFAIAGPDSSSATAPVSAVGQR